MTPHPAKLRAALDAIDNLESALEALEPHGAFDHVDLSAYAFEVMLNKLHKHLQRLEQQALNPTQP